MKASNNRATKVALPRRTTVNTKLKLVLPEPVLPEAAQEGFMQRAVAGIRKVAHANLLTLGALWDAHRVAMVARVALVAAAVAASASGPRLRRSRPEVRRWARGWTMPTSRAPAGNRGRRA